MGIKYIFKAKPSHVELTSSLFIKYANDCYEAAHFFNDKKYFSITPYYLYCKSIEISLKAFLVHNGIKIRDLKNTSEYGHNIEKILIKSKIYKLEELINFTDIEIKELKKAGSLYDIKNKSFEYPLVIDAVRGYNNFPDLKILKTMAKKLLKVKDLL